MVEVRHACFVLTKLHQCPGSEHASLGKAGLAGEETIERDFSRAELSSFEQRPAPPQVDANETGIQLSRSVIVGESRLPITVVAMKFASLQVEPGILGILTDLV